MRNLKFFALVSFFLAFTMPQAANVAGALHQQNISQNSNYVVIGAFSIRKNAVKFTAYGKNQNMDAHFDLNPNRNLYYVYVLKTDDHEQALREAVRLRENSEFLDAWVYNGIMGEAPQVESGKDYNPVTEEVIEIQPTDQTSPIVVNEVSEADITAVPTTANEPSNAADDEINGKKFKFSLYRATDNEMVTGNVDIIDPDKTRKIGTYKGNETVRIPDPNNKSGNVTLVCEVFGYRKAQRDIPYKSPEGDDISKDSEGNTVIPFELVRLQKGDIAVMYNVYFFKDAGVMRPESRYEINSLVEMLKENPKYKIKIHGHTNGGAPGKIISMGDSRNYFSLNDTKEGFGSAKKLSEERATVIRDYLVSEGIESKRTIVKAWGGKRPIHEKHSTRANENVRVEIEILEDK